MNKIRPIYVKEPHGLIVTDNYVVKDENFDGLLGYGKETTTEKVSRKYGEGIQIHLFVATALKNPSATFEILQALYN